MQTNPTLPTSKHFRLERLTEGVYAAIAIVGSGAMSNAGIIDLGGETLIFDTFWTPQAAHDLREAAQALTGRTPTYVINSHADSDHVHGNQIFAGSAHIVATEETRQAIARRGQEFLEWARANFAAYIRTREQYVEREQDEKRNARLALDLATQQEFARALPEMELALPNLTFEHSIAFHGTHRRAELRAPGGGHSESDSMLLLEDDRIAFMGDLLFVRSHPSTWRGDTHSWITILEQVGALNLEQLIPGHGPVGTREDVEQLRQLLQEMLRLAGTVIERGGSAAEAGEIAIPAPYDRWEQSELFGRNMHHMHRLLSPQQKDPALLPRKETYK